jgi:uncharacterized membrane protein
VNLSDAVVAIAATLLILPLVDSANELGHQPVRAFLADHIGQLAAFVLSFVVIARFWRVHHDMYTAVVGFSAPLIWANFTWLLGIVFLPLPTELIASPFVHDTTADGLYVGTMLFTSLAALVQKQLILRSPSLQAEPDHTALRLGPQVASVLALVVAFLIAVALPGVGLYGLLLLIPAALVERRLLRRNRLEAPR